MKKVINGKIYNTDTAIEITYHSYSNYSDFNYLCETLYKTQKGNYFLHGEGGAASKYAEYISQGTRSGSSVIISMTSVEALTWVEENFEDTPECIFTEFSDLLESA